MAQILYVHGAGNRADVAGQYAEALRARLGLTAAPDRLAVSEWGARRGPDAALPKIDLTLPPTPPGVRAGAPGRTLTDPYAPLRELAPTRGARAAGTQDKTDADQLLAFLALGGFDMPEEELAADRVRAAAEEVAGSSDYRAASADPVDLIDATAMSVLAVAATRPAKGRRAATRGIDLGWLGDRASDLAASVLGAGPVAAVGAWVGPKLTAPLALWASQRLAPKRSQIMHERMMAAIDVLFYQRSGQAIRDHVAGEIAALEAPRLVIGHSLGGIILVDTLFGADAPNTDVALLVTFGSQAPFLAAFGALGDDTPRVPWLNFWTRYDFVSFLGAGIWPGQVDDRELEIDVGFPEAHGAYYESDEMARQIRAHPAATGVFDAAGKARRRAGKPRSRTAAAARTRGR